MIDALPLAEGDVPLGPGHADFESFYRANRVRLFRALVVMTRDVHGAEELTQESFVKVWERWERVARMDDPIGYLYRTALNGWLQIHRRATRAGRQVVAPRRVVAPLEVVEDRTSWLASASLAPHRPRPAGRPGQARAGGGARFGGGPRLGRGVLVPHAIRRAGR